MRPTLRRRRSDEPNLSGWQRAGRRGRTRRWRGSARSRRPRSAEILELAPTTGRSAGHQDTFQRHAITRGADEPTLLAGPGPGHRCLSAIQPSTSTETNTCRRRSSNFASTAHRARRAPQSRASNAASARSLAAVAAFGFASAASGSCGDARADRLEARPGLVELVEVVDVLPPPDPVRVVLRHDDGGDLEQSFRLASPKPPDGERPPIIEAEDVLRAQHGIGSQIAQCTDALHVGVARARSPNRADGGPP